VPCGAIAKRFGYACSTNLAPIACESAWNKDPVFGAFSWYLRHAANYTATYGALGAVIGMTMWIWLSAVVVLVGAKRRSNTRRLSTPTIGPPKPLGKRGAVMADTVGPDVA
jgi:hypothetical protein